MNNHRKRACLAAVLLFVSGVFVHALGNDGAASSAVGGIQLRREANVSMERERLAISGDKVTVEYEFLNKTDKDITTEVAFPIPPYSYAIFSDASDPYFDDFRLWVEGKELKYDVDARAKVEGEDYTDLLKGMGMDIPLFGGWETDHKGHTVGPIAKLKKEQVNQLATLGLIGIGPTNNDDMVPMWQVAKTYYWTQTFPAHKVLHVRHEYTPEYGYQAHVPDELDAKNQLLGENGIEDEFKHACVDPLLRQGLMDQMARNGVSEFRTSWVDYILTTANTWKTPIADFTLIIDKRLTIDEQGGPLYRNATRYVTLCWDGPVKKLDANRFIAHEAKFVPKKELHIVFVSVPSPTHK
jgi:hypothetical protein